MTINFENYGEFSITLFYDDDTHDTYNSGLTLKASVDWVAQNMKNSLSIVSADIIDVNTGEVVVIIEKDEDDTTEEWYDYRDDYDECGYNPYMGCYDFEQS